jgi:molecular chaperone DnaK
MVREAEAHADEDRQKKEMAEARNQADSMAYTAERTLRESGDKVPAELKSEVEGKIAAVRSALNGQDVAYIRRTMQELSDSLQKIGSAVYGQPGQQGGPGEQAGPGAPGGPGQQPGGGPQQEGTVEGEYREV